MLFDGARARDDFHQYNLREISKILLLKAYVFYATLIYFTQRLFILRNAHIFYAILIYLRKPTREFTKELSYPHGTCMKILFPLVSLAKSCDPINVSPRTFKLT